jgi:uncharacterized phage infection (PIP) family protein YhgE
MEFLILLVVLGALFGIHLKFQSAEEQKKRSAEQAAEQAAREAREESERQQYLAQQKQLRGQIEQLRGQIASINEESLSTFEQMTAQLRSAEEHLDQAERDFSEGAFAPFWDSVERAAFALGGFEERVRKVESNLSQYIDLVKKARTYEIKASAFSVSAASAQKLKIASETSRRMNGVVRNAQRNFQFSMIYEQRKTNQILVAGFRNLAQALEEMTWRITQSIDDLSTSVHSMSATLNDSLRQIHDQRERIANAIHDQGERIANATEGLRADSSTAAAGSSVREQKALEMLDNIQRDRYPSFTHGGLR